MTSLPASVVERCVAVDIRARRARRSAIYFLVEIGEVVYVGRSDDVDKRIEWHVAYSTMDFDRVLWLPVAEEDLAAYEAALIRFLRPRYNRRCARDSSRDAAILTELGFVVADETRCAS